MKNEKTLREVHFREATKGVSNHQIARALNKLRPGVDWRNSTKGSMISAWLGQNKGFEMDGYSTEQLRVAVNNVLNGK